MHKIGTGRDWNVVMNLEKARRPALDRTIGICG
jgi:hypothetical protein